MRKKGQITLFVILAITILFIMGLIVYLGIKKDFFQTIEKTPEETSVKDFISQCISSTLEDAVTIIGLQGGYLVKPDNFISTNLSFISYGEYEGKNTLPKTEEIEKAISKYIDLFSYSCFDTSYFPELEIDLSSPKTKTSIYKDQITITTVIPATIRKGNTTFYLNENYEKELKVGLGKITKTAAKIIESDLLSNKAINLGELKNTGFDIVVYAIDSKNAIYAITDQKSKINEKPYIFMYAKKI